VPTKPVSPDYDSIRRAGESHIVVLPYLPRVVYWDPGLVMEIPARSAICRSHKSPVCTNGDPVIGIKRLELPQGIGLWLRVGELPILVVLSEGGST